VEANSTGGQGSRRALAPSDDDDHRPLKNVFYEAILTQDVQTAVSFTLFYSMYDVYFLLDSMQYLIFHKIGPNQLDGN
jgi:hypothetical protein